MCVSSFEVFACSDPIPNCWNAKIVIHWGSYRVIFWSLSGVWLDRSGVDGNYLGRQLVIDGSAYPYSVFPTVVWILPDGGWIDRMAKWRFLDPKGTTPLHLSICAFGWLVVVIWMDQPSDPKLDLSGWRAPFMGGAWILGQPGFFYRGSCRIRNCSFPGDLFWGRVPAVIFDVLERKGDPLLLVFAWLVDVGPCVGFSQVFLSLRLVVDHIHSGSYQLQTRAAHPAEVHSSRPRSSSGLFGNRYIDLWVLLGNVECIFMAQMDLSRILFWLLENFRNAATRLSGLPAFWTGVIRRVSLCDRFFIWVSKGFAGWENSNWPLAYGSASCKNRLWVHI